MFRRIQSHSNAKSSKHCTRVAIIQSMPSQKQEIIPQSQRNEEGSDFYHFLKRRTLYWINQKIESHTSRSTRKCQKSWKNYAANYSFRFPTYGQTSYLFTSSGFRSCFSKSIWSRVPTVVFEHDRQGPSECHWIEAKKTGRQTKCIV